MMRERDEIALFLRQSGLETRVPQPARSRFQAQLFALRQLSRPHRIAIKGNFSFSAIRFRKFGVSERGLTADPVFHVNGGDAETALRRPRAEIVKERHGISAARKSDGNRFPAQQIAEIKRFHERIVTRIPSKKQVFFEICKNFENSLDKPRRIYYDYQAP